ncbi:MAG: HesA/MoeB/ThiF family protein [Chitinophagaceae bacterium]
MKRYNKQESVLEWGIKGQEYIKKARILVVGAGGLGCPALQYLLGAGIGFIGIVDGDIVSEENLHRQLVYTETQIGLNKAIAAKHNLQLSNHEVQIKGFDFYLSKENAQEIILDYDLVLDCTDDLAIRHVIHQACHTLQKPLILAANYLWEGYVIHFSMQKDTARLQDIFPEQINDVPTCNNLGAIGPVLGVLGSLQAIEALKIITKHPSMMCNQLFHINLKTMQTSLIQIK